MKKTLLAQLANIKATMLAAELTEPDCECYKEASQDIHNAAATIVEMRGAMQTFVTRVEHGEIRSKRTYAQFKHLLEL